MNNERRIHRGITIFVGVIIINALFVLGFIFSDHWVRMDINHKLRTPITASVTFLAPYASNSFVYEIAFISVLALILLLVAAIPILRKLYFAVILIPTGYAEFFSLPHSVGGILVPPEIYILPFTVMASGFIIPILYVFRQFLGRKESKLMLILWGCSELVLGAMSLFFMPLVSVGVGGDPRVWTYLDSRFFLLGAILVTVAIYSLAVGTFLFMTKPKNVVANKEQV